MISNIETLGFKKMTAIQEESLPHILQRKDVIAQAKTGSGKTAAFAIGLLAGLDTEIFKVGALVLCPTRELADQVSKEIRRIARHIHNVKILTLCGGTPMGPQIRSLEHGAHIVVGTPGRIQDHISRNTLNLKQIRTLVLDEADRMLDMGFLAEIKAIISKTPRNRQTLLFSATYPATIEKMSQDFQECPIQVKVETTHKKSQIQQVIVEVEKAQKPDALVKILGHYKIESAVIFCQTKIQCDQLAEHLLDAGFFVEALHGDLDQRQRDDVLTLFSNGTLTLLVATDVAARGLDIKSLQCVISFDLTPDPEIHVHRIGRTGRADEEGLAISLVTSKDKQKLSNIESYMKQTFENRTSMDEISFSGKPPLPRKATIRIEGGKKNKMRPGDILGALTKDKTIPGSAVGNINLFPFHAFVAIDRPIIKKALDQLTKNPIKGKMFKSRIIR